MWLRNRLAQRVDASSLGLFRIVWGLLMVWEAIRKLPKVTGIYSPEYFHFKYSLFPFIEPLPEIWMMRIEVCVLLAAAIAITLGVCFRFSSLVFGLIYAHLFLLEKIYYNNHFYLTILVAFLLMLTDAHKCYSVGWWWKRSHGDLTTTTIPRWNLVLLRGQWIVVYFFGGVAKLNSDWLAGEPLRYWFSARSPDHVLAPLLHAEWFAWLAVWVGLLLDLTAGFLLLHRKTRIPVALVLISFHLTNHLLFKIGLFPWIGIASLLLFVDPHRPRWLFDKVVRCLRRERSDRESPAPISVSAAPLSWVLTSFVVAYLACQALWPLRTWSYRENPSWSEVGHCFSWRMMLRHKDAFMQLRFSPPEAERYLEEHPEILPKISLSHLQRMVKSPQLILQYVHKLDEVLEENGWPDVKIRCISVVSLNGRPYQLMLDPRRDLTEVSYGFLEVPDWIQPLEKYGRPGQYPKTAEERALALQRAVDKYRRQEAMAAGPAADRRQRR